MNIRQIWLFSIVVVFLSVFVTAQNIDPLIYVEPNYVPLEVIPNPGEAAWGDIVGADAFNNGQDFVLMWSNGVIGFYHEGESVFYDAFQVTAGTGITEVPSDLYPGPIAISDEIGIDFWDFDGNFIDGIGTSTSDIRDITYDQQRDRFIVSTTSDGTGWLNEEGGVEFLVSSGAFGIEAIDLTDENGTIIDDLLQTGEVFHRMFEDGSIGDGELTDLGVGGAIQGMAFTQNQAIMAFTAGYVIFDKLAFQDFLNYQVQLSVPQITLINPQDAHNETTNNTIIFEYSVSHDSPITQCSLIINNETVFNDTTITLDIPQQFEHTLNNGAYTWQVSCLGSEGFSEIRTLTVDVNTAPVLEPIGNQAVNEGEQLSIILNASDVDNDNLTFGIMESLPIGFSFDPVLGIFDWTSTFNDSGEYNVTFNVTDADLSDEETITIIVIDVTQNTAPELTFIGDRETDENVELVIGLDATDAENDSLTFGTNAFQVLPSAFTFNENTGLFQWTPTFNDAGDYIVTFNVTDGEFTDQETITLTVNNINQAPILAPVGNFSVDEEVLLAIQLNATDPDGDEITFGTNALEVLPSAFIFNSSSGIFEWIPTFNDAGDYNVTFNVSW